MFRRKNDHNKPTITSSPSPSSSSLKPPSPLLESTSSRDDSATTPNAKYVSSISRRNPSLSPNHKCASTYSPACTTTMTTTAITTGEIGPVTLNNSSSTRTGEVANGSSRSRRTSTAMSTRSAKGKGKGAQTGSYNKQPSWRTAALPASVSRVASGSVPGVSMSGLSTLSGSEPSTSLNGVGNPSFSAPQHNTGPSVSMPPMGGAPLAASVSIVFAEPETVAPAMGSATRSMDRTVKSVTSRSSLRSGVSVDGVWGHSKGKERERDSHVTRVNEEDGEDEGERGAGDVVDGVLDLKPDLTPIPPFPPAHTRLRSPSPSISHPRQDETDSTPFPSHPSQLDSKAPSLPLSLPPSPPPPHPSLSTIPGEVESEHQNGGPTPLDQELEPTAHQTTKSVNEHEPKFRVEVVPPTPKVLQVGGFSEGVGEGVTSTLPGSSNVDKGSPGPSAGSRWRWGRSASTSTSGRSTPTPTIAKPTLVSTESDEKKYIQEARRVGKMGESENVSMGETEKTKKQEKKKRKWFTSPPPTPPPLTAGFGPSGVSSTSPSPSSPSSNGVSALPTPARLTTGIQDNVGGLVDRAQEEQEEGDCVPGTPPPEYVDAVAALRHASIGMHESLMTKDFGQQEKVEGEAVGSGMKGVDGHGGDGKTSSTLTSTSTPNLNSASTAQGVGPVALPPSMSNPVSTSMPAPASSSGQPPALNDSSPSSESTPTPTSVITKKASRFLFGYGYGVGVGGVLPLGVPVGLGAGAGAGMGMGMGLGAPLLGVGTKSGGGGGDANDEDGAKGDGKEGSASRDGHADSDSAAAAAASTATAMNSPSPSSTSTIPQSISTLTPTSTSDDTPIISVDHSSGSAAVGQERQTGMETTEVNAKDKEKSGVVENGAALTQTEIRMNLDEGKQGKKNGTWWDYVGWSSGGGGGGGDALGSPGSVPDPNPNPNQPTKANTEEHLEGMSQMHEGPKSVDGAAVRVGELEEEHGRREGEGDDLTEASKNDCDGQVKVAAETSEKDNAGATGSGVNALSGTVQKGWLAPWSWYYSSPSSNVGGAPEPCTGTMTVAKEEEETNQPDCEAQADAALEGNAEAAKNVDGVEESQSQLQIPPQSRIEDHEEIVDTLMIKTQTSTWASFFSSNGLLVKSLAYASSSRSTSVSRRKQVTMGEEGIRKDENGVEVMDIDSDDDHDRDHDQHRGRTLTKKRSGTSDRTAVISASGSALPAMSTKSGANPIVDSSSSTTTTTNMSTPTPTSSNASGSTAVATRSIAASITSTAAQTLKRAVSPAPSTSSSVSTNTVPPSSSAPAPVGNPNTNKIPPKNTSSSQSTTSAGPPGSGSTNKPAPAPPPPNLVLPTWNDTFFVPPRSVVPPRPAQASPRAKRKHRDGGIKPTREGVGEGEGLLGRTMKFVSGVLFAAKDAGTNTAAAASGQSPGSPSSIHSAKMKSKGKERATHAHNLSREMNMSNSSSTSTSTLAPESGHGHLFPLDAETDTSRLLPKAWKVYEDAGWDTGVRSRSGPQNPGLGEEMLDSSPSPTYPYPLSSLSPSSSTSSDEKAESDDEMEGQGMYEDTLRGSKRIVVIGVHGWFPGTMIRSVLGEPTGTSHKFASMTCAALSAFEVAHGVKFDKVTMIPLEGEGVIERRVDRLHQTLLANPSWIQDLHDADAVLVATHSQGSVVSTHLVERLLREGVLVSGVGGVVGNAGGDESVPTCEAQTKAEVEISDEKPNSSRAGSRSQSRTPVPTTTISVSATLSGTETPTTPTSPAPISPSPSSASASASGSGSAPIGIVNPAKDKGKGKTGGSGATSPLQVPTPSGSYKPPISGPSVGPSPAQAQLQATSQLQSTTITTTALPPTPAASTHKYVPKNTAAHKNKNTKPQKILILALCGIHLGPLRYLGTSTLVGPYLQWFESAAARELFEFQNTESAVSKAYVKALERVLAHGTKIVYVASLNDQVVPIYSGLFTAVSHPLILRALYIDGDAYHSSDFLSNLLVLLLRIKNAGLSDSGLIAHLSEATAGSLNGVGHSTAYEELGVYSLAVNYLFLVDDGAPTQTRTTPLDLEHFNAAHEQNDYEIPWSLRDVIADPRVSALFGKDIGELRDAFREWNPKTTILRELKRKLSPIQRLGAGSVGVGSVRSAESKL